THYKPRVQYITVNYIKNRSSPPFCQQTGSKMNHHNSLPHLPEFSGYTGIGIGGGSAIAREDAEVIVSKTLILPVLIVPVHVRSNLYMTGIIYIFTTFPINHSMPNDWHLEVDFSTKYMQEVYNSNKIENQNV
ncbi:hypothetical protein ACJX0J_030142, partial [Zea mays]